MHLEIIQYKDKNPLDEIRCNKCGTSYTYEDYRILAENYKLMFVESQQGFPVCNLCFMDFIKSFLKKSGNEYLKVSFDGEKKVDFVFKSKEL